MAIRLKRASLIRAAVVAAVCAFPLFAVGTAQASIAGANPITTTNRPDLRSATILNQSSAGGGSVEVCFNRALDANSPAFNDPHDMNLGGYRSAVNADPTSIAAETSPLKPDCAVMTFSPSAGDLFQYTIVSVGPGTVTTSSTPNLRDSVTLTGSLTHNGTTGLMTPPNLIGPQSIGTGGSGCSFGSPTFAPNCNATENTITFVFDKALIPGSDNHNNYWFSNSSGKMCSGTSDKVSGLSVTVQFANSGCTSPTNNVTSAVRVGVFRDAIFAVSDCNGSFCRSNANSSALMPNAINGNPTTLPNLIGAQLQSNGTVVAYQFNKPVSASNPTNATDFEVYLSNGHRILGSNAVVAANNTVQVTFNGLNDSTAHQNEYAILAAVNGIAVVDGPVDSVNQSGTCTSCSNTNNVPTGTPVYTDLPGSAPIGDNAGAFARGFTTGPDAYATVFDPTTGNVTIDFDQRVGFQFECTSPNPNNGPGTYTSCTNGNLFLLNKVGDQLSEPSSIVIPSLPSVAGPEAITATFPTADFASGNPAVAVQLADWDVFSTQLNCDTGCTSSGESVPQILAPIGSGARLHRLKALHRSHKKNRRHHTR